MSNIAANRYLNLSGAPYSPSKPNAKLTLTNYFTAAATSLAIFGAAYANPSVQKNHLLYLGEGFLGSAMALAFIVRRKKEEIEKISAHHEQLVIDTCPDNGTPPTPPSILTRVTDLKNQYSTRSVLRMDSLKGAAIDILLGVGDAKYLLERPNPHYYAVVMPLFTIHAMDIFMRYRQFDKIANLKWVITDQGNAIKTFQKEEVEELSRVCAMEPAGMK